MPARGGSVAIGEKPHEFSVVTIGEAPAAARATGVLPLVLGGQAIASRAFGGLRLGIEVM
jgi:hypothetical protein